LIEYIKNIFQNALTEKISLIKISVFSFLQISIGNLDISVGQVTIQHQAKLNLAGNKTIVPVTLIGVLLVLMCICVICMRRKRVGPFKRKILHHETSVRFHAESSVPQMTRRLMPDPDPESSTSARLNGTKY
jgi:hypothetical protein